MSSWVFEQCRLSLASAALSDKVATPGSQFSHGGAEVANAKNSRHPATLNVAFVASVEDLVKS